MACQENCKCRPGVVAFIFVPGIMGSRLQNKKSGELVWDPGAGFFYKGLSSEGKENLEELKREFEEVLSKKPESIYDPLLKPPQILKLSSKITWEYFKEGFRYIRRIRGGISSISDYAFAGPEKRKKMLVTEDLKFRGEHRDDDLLEVASGDDKYFKVFTSVPPSQINLKKSRGWGEILWDSYGPFLSYLEEKEHELIQLYPGLRFPVFAVGYNWMLSNEVSGERIKQKLAEYKAQILQQDDRGISEGDIKFIILSHSMGGMASRSALMLSNLASEVEGVIHCAMPTYGSPDSYKRMRCGQDGTSKFVIGKNAADITAILGFCQGGLELLPNQLYKTADNKAEWLFYTADKTGKDKKPIPVQYNAEIYQFYKQYNLWYSLIQPKLLAPELTDKKLKQQKYLDKYIEAYEERIGVTEQFHHRLADGFHPTTTLIYSDNPANKSYDHCCWRGKKMPKGDINQWKAIVVNNHKTFGSDGKVSLIGAEELQHYNEELKHFIENNKDYSVSKSSRAIPPTLSLIEFIIEPATANGDGTVHMGSGEHPIAAGGLKKVPITASKEHQDIYQCPHVREAALSQIKEWVEDIHHKMGG